MKATAQILINARRYAEMGGSSIMTEGIVMTETTMMEMAVAVSAE